MIATTAAAPPKTAPRRVPVEAPVAGGAAAAIREAGANEAVGEGESVGPGVSVGVIEGDAPMRIVGVGLDVPVGV